MDKGSRYDDPSAELLDGCKHKAGGIDFQQLLQYHRRIHSCQILESQNVIIGDHLPIPLVKRMTKRRPIRSLTL